MKETKASSFHLIASSTCSALCPPPSRLPPPPPASSQLVSIRDRSAAIILHNQLLINCSGRPPPIIIIIIIIIFLFSLSLSLFLPNVNPHPISFFNTKERTEIRSERWQQQQWFWFGKMEDESIRAGRENSTSGLLLWNGSQKFYLTSWVENSNRRKCNRLNLVSDELFFQVYFRLFLDI